MNQNEVVDLEAVHLELYERFPAWTHDLARIREATDRARQLLAGTSEGDSVSEEILTAWKGFLSAEGQQDLFSATAGASVRQSAAFVDETIAGNRRPGESLPRTEARLEAEFAASKT